MKRDATQNSDDTVFFETIFDKNYSHNVYNITDKSQKSAKIKKQVRMLICEHKL